MRWRGIEFDGEYWETSELGSIREGMIKMIDFLGFSRFTTIIQGTPEGQLTLVKLGGNMPSEITPGKYAGAKTWDDEILFSAVTFDPGRHPNWTFVHEFAHIWDQDGVLSEQFERLTGGMDRFVWDSRFETGQWRWDAGPCGFEPSLGSPTRYGDTNPREDFADTFLSLIYPGRTKSEHHSRVTSFERQLFFRLAVDRGPLSPRELANWFDDIRFGW